MAALLAHRQRRRWRRALARHRRPIAAGLLGVAVAAALHARAPAAPATEQVLVAARDLPAGRTIEGGDVAWQAWLSGTAPRGTQRVVAGRVLASALRAGEPITDARLTGPGLLTGQPAGTRAVTVRLADPSAAGLVRPGDRVDVLATTTSGAGSPGRADPVDVVVEGAVVLASPAGCGPGPDGTGGAAVLSDLTGRGGTPGCTADPSTVTGSGFGTSAGSAVLVLAVDAIAARHLASAVIDRSLSVAIRG